MHDFLWYLLCIIAILNWWLYITRILPKLREYRTIYLRDWGFSLFQPLKNLKESIEFHIKMGFQIEPGNGEKGGFFVTLDYNRPGDPKVLFTKILS